MSNKRLKIISIVAGLILIAAGFALSQGSVKSTAPSDTGSGVTSGSASPKSASDSFTFPKTLQGLALSQTIAGPQAIGMISKLHGSSIKIKEGYIGQYNGSAGQIMIWISESGNTAEARQLFDIMDRKITSAAQDANSSGGAPPFTDRRTLSRNGISVIAVKGMGMENYYYQVGSRVFWLAIGGVNPTKILDEFIR